MKDNNYWKDYRQCVQEYEKYELKADEVNEIDTSPLIVSYQGVRRCKLVVILDENPLSEIINSIYKRAASLIDSNPTFSENVELFSLSTISDSQRIEFDSLFMKNGLSLTIIDRIQMQKIGYFSHLFIAREDTIDYDSFLYEYLSMGNETFDVKNSLFYALLLMMVYKNEPINSTELEKIIYDKYDKDADTVRLALKDLRRQKKILPPGKGDTLMLNGDEKTKIEQSLKEEKSKEEEFLSRYNSIINKYNVVNGDEVLSLLREAYHTQYQWHSQSNDDEKKKDAVGRKQFEIIEKNVNSQIGNQTVNFIEELRQLCETNDYLSRYSLSHSFLQLFQSSSYANYINNKENCIFLDTPVVTNYLCYLCKLDEKNDIEWDNPDYQSVKSLARLKESNKDNISFHIPYDYLQETVGELKKALQFSWFDQIELAIPFETGNTFYNYYRFVKKGRKENGDDVKDFSFLDFVKQMGFQDCNPDASLFSKHTLAYLKYLLDKTDNIIIDPIKEHYDEFDNVRYTYMYNELENNKKTDPAINNDVRQALFITYETQQEYSNGLSYFLATWDKTLRGLRDIVKEEMKLELSYSVMNPANLANKMAFRNFKLSEKGVSNDVFAYANNSYNLDAKVQSLYDNVLTPYFANSSNHNTKLVSTLLKMEKDCQDSETSNARYSKEKTVLADIFLPIVDALKDNQLSTQNLREFLADENNNIFVINLVKEAYEKYSNGETLDISDRFCKKMKENLSKNNEEIKL